MTVKPEMIARRDAAQATLDRFMGVDFVWGKADCVRLAAFNLRQLGYKPRLSKGGAYSSFRGAVKALNLAGFSDLVEAVDAQGLPQIAPSQAVVGDLIALPGEEGWPALTVCLGNGRVVGWKADRPDCGVMQPLTPILAWRARPCLTP